MGRRATAERSPALATERGAGGGLRSTLNTAWDSRKACHTSWAERRRLSPRQAGLPSARHSYLVTSASRNPRLSRLRLSSSPRRSPAPRRPDGLSERGARRLHWQLTVEECVPLFTFHWHRVFVPEARRTRNICHTAIAATGTQNQSILGTILSIGCCIQNCVVLQSRCDTS